MPHVITDACVKCMSCVEVCPVSCIHPGLLEPELDTAKQLYIDPDECIHCGACASECPSNAIYPAEELPADKANFAKINADYFKK